jgi:hypothetical protein
MLVVILEEVTQAVQVVRPHPAVVPEVVKSVVPALAAAMVVQVVLLQLVEQHIMEAAVAAVVLLLLLVIWVTVQLLTVAVMDMVQKQEYLETIHQESPVQMV